MKGIYGEEVLLTLFAILLFTFGMIQTIYVLIDLKSIEKKNEISEEQRNFELKEVVATTMSFIVLCVAILGGLYLSFIYEIKIINICCIILGILFIGLGVTIAISEFVQYIFFKPFKYQLTLQKENSLFIMGTLIFCFCYVFAAIDASQWLSEKIYLMADLWSDIIQMFILVFWYFSVFFFSLSFSILIAHKLVVFISKKEKNSKKNECNQNIKKFKSIESKIIKKRFIKIDELLKTNSNKQSFFNFVWLVCIFVNVLDRFLRGFLLFLYLIFSYIFIIFPRNIGKWMKNIIKKLRKNQGKGVIISSRISLVCSMFIVYIVDKYNSVFSKAGSEVYEFLCSVLIIPFLITQLSELNKRILEDSKSNS